MVCSEFNISLLLKLQWGNIWLNIKSCVKRPEEVSDKVHKVVVINKNLPWESVSSKVALKENGVSFLEVSHHGVPTDHGNPWIFSRNVLMALFSLFNCFFNSFDLSV